MARSINALFDLSGKTALVTGGSRGLGLQMAEALGEAGARILVTARKEDELTQAVTHLKSRNIEADWVAADCADPASIKKLCDTAISRLGHVDILVNNAGAAWGAPAEDHPLEAWDKVMNLNIRGYFLLSQMIGKLCMIPRHSGRIINLASIAGLGGNPEDMQTIAYNTSKGAVLNFTRALAAEWGHHNITVNAICPGFFPSKMTAHWADQADEMASAFPRGRIGTPEDAAGTAIYLSSRASAWVTGHIVVLDGGAVAAA